jgi:hypothetical protein
MDKSRLGLIAIILAIIFGLGLVIGLVVPRLVGFGSGPKIYSTPTILQQVQTLSQLVTVKYVMEQMVAEDDVKWLAGLGENKVILIAHGVVKAGIDLSKIEKEDLKISGKKVRIKLPPAQITDAYLDDKQTRVFERSTGLFRTFDKDLEQTARQHAVDDIRRNARIGGIQKDADERARAQLTNLFRQLGFEEIEFVK